MHNEPQLCQQQNFLRNNLQPKKPFSINSEVEFIKLLGEELLRAKTLDD